MDWSESNLCVKCDKGGNVLVCNETGCPLAVHEGCLGGPARLDDVGRFCCPYCVYKRATEEMRKAREFLLARKKALLVFMNRCEKDKGGNKTGEGNGKNQSNVNDNGESKSNNDGIVDQPRSLGEEEKVEEDSESSGGSEYEDPSLEMNDGNVEEKQIREEEREVLVEKDAIQEEKCETVVGKNYIREVERESSVEKENVGEEEQEVSNAEEDSESSGGSEDEDPSLKMNNGNVEEKQIREEKHEVLLGKGNIQEEEREASVEKENVGEEEWEASVEKETVWGEEREASVEEESIREKDFETPSSSTNQDSSLTSKRVKLMDKESEAISVMQSKFSKQRDKKKQASPASFPAKKSAMRSPLAMGAGKLVMKGFASPRRMSKSEKQSKKSDASGGSRKRRRLMWTEEEEEALREEVREYRVGTNIPWKKILEGSDKFDPARTPADLKDKWRIQQFV